MEEERKKRQQNIQNRSAHIQYVIIALFNDHLHEFETVDTRMCAVFKRVRPLKEKPWPDGEPDHPGIHEEATQAEESTQA